MATVSKVPSFWPAWSWRGSGRWLCTTTQMWFPQVRAGILEACTGREGEGSKRVGVLAQGFWQGTSRAEAAGISRACDTMAELVEAWGVGGVGEGGGVGGVEGVGGTGGLGEGVEWAALFKWTV